MGAELQHAIEHGNDDANVDVFVLTGAGRGFCAGADIKDLFKNQADAGDDGSNERPARDWVGLVRRAKPMIAAVNGAAVGVGLTQILPCDYIMASPDAKFMIKSLTCSQAESSSNPLLVSPPMGNQSSLTEKNNSNSEPNAYPGTAYPTKISIEDISSDIVLCRTALKIPSGIHTM